jgi:hypothetical protein
MASALREITDPKIKRAPLAAKRPGVVERAVSAERPGTPERVEGAADL